MDTLAELREGLNGRRERIMANPADYSAGEFKYRTDELRIVVQEIDRVLAGQKQPALRKTA